MKDIRVALIEDHDLTRAGLRATLEQCGQVQMVGEASNGLQGLKLLERTLPDIAIVDIGLPDIDGIELTRRFRQFLTNLAQTESDRVEKAKTKIMMLTMQHNEDSVLAAFAAGADSYCMKDASLERLIQALEITSEGNSWIDPSIARIVLHKIHSNQPINQFTKGIITEKRVSINALESEYDQIISAYPLTDRELEVLELMVSGCSNGAIAVQLYITIGTVKTHVRNILNKLCVNDRTQAAVLALRSGLVG
jgi:two-component system, NarL family, response regulator LiaR